MKFVPLHMIRPFYLWGLAATLIILLIAPDQAFKADKLVVSGVVILYSMVFYLFIEKNFIISIPPDRKWIVKGASGLLFSALFVQLALSATVPILFAAKLLLTFIPPIGLVLLKKSDIGKFHPLDLLAFLLIFIPVETRFVSIPLAYQSGILKFDTIFTTMALLAMLLFLGYRKIDMGLTWRFSRQVWAETIGFTLLLIALECILGFSTGWLTFAGWQIDLKKAVLVSLFMFFHGSLIEEIFFRGLIYNYFMQFNEKHGFLINILINTMIFGATHYNNGGFPAVGLASLAGFFFCLVYYRTRNIFCVTFIHAVTNLVWQTIFSTH